MQKDRGNRLDAKVIGASATAEQVSNTRELVVHLIIIRRYLYVTGSTASRRTALQLGRAVYYTAELDLP